MKNTMLALPAVIAAVLSAPVAAAPSYTPGISPVSSPCDGLVEIREWAQNVVGDGLISEHRFVMMGVSNPDMFIKYPWVSSPSLTLSYQLKPGTEDGAFTTVTAVLEDTAGTGRAEDDISAPQTWTITAQGCTDADLDGIADEIDPVISELVDTDGDGIYDVLDDDDDNDGISDFDEGNGLVDTDGDGIPDSLDTDSDSDDIMDSSETGDQDGDGIGDSQEADGTDVTTDTDGDGITDDLDTDDDGDGLTDAEEGNGTVDTDGDGIPDSLDPDSNNDGIGDDGNIIDDQPVVLPQSGDDTSMIETGLNGGGCTLKAGSAFDPLLLLTGLFALLGVQRRRLFK